jgi:ribosomal protein S6
MVYELFYLIGASKETELEKIKSEAEKIVTDNGGVFSEKTTIEKRRLSYIVKHETHGVYIARRFELETPENMKDISTKFNLHPEILRFIISKAEDLPQLKSKEERMEESNKKESAVKIKKEEREAKEEKEKKKEKISTTKEETTSNKTDEKEEDIDKKLEEILNI